MHPVVSIISDLFYFAKGRGVSIYSRPVPAITNIKCVGDMVKELVGIVKIMILCLPMGFSGYFAVLTGTYARKKQWKKAIIFGIVSAVLILISSYLGKVTR